MLQCTVETGSRDKLSDEEKFMPPGYRTVKARRVVHRYPAPVGIPPVEEALLAQSG